MCFDGDRFTSHASPKKKTNMLKGFKFPSFVGCFPVNIVAVKGLSPGAPVLTAGGLNTQTLHKRAG